MATNLSALLKNKATASQFAPLSTNVEGFSAAPVSPTPAPSPVSPAYRQEYIDNMKRTGKDLQSKIDQKAQSQTKELPTFDFWQHMEAQKTYNPIWAIETQAQQKNFPAPYAKSPEVVSQEVEAEMATKRPSRVRGNMVENTFDIIPKAKAFDQMLLEDDEVKALVKAGATDEEILQINDDRAKERWLIDEQPQEPAQEQPEEQWFWSSVRLPEVWPAYSAEEIQQSWQFGKAGKFAANIATSGLNLLSNVWNIGLHPIDTAKALWTIAEWLAQWATRVVLEKVAPGKFKNLDTKEQEAAFQAIDNMIVKRYGSLENFKKTSMEDPVWVFWDVISLVEGWAGLVWKTAQVWEVSKLGKVAEFARSAEKWAQAVNPYIQLPKYAAKWVGKLAKWTWDLSAQVLGKTTGTSADTIREAFKQWATSEFKEALRGTKAPEQILEDVRTGLQEIKDNRSVAYWEKYKLLQRNKSKLPLENLKNEFADTIKNDYGVTIWDDWKLDFSQSKITQPTSQSHIQAMYDDLSNWKDNTPVGQDILKQRLQDRYIGTAESAKSDRLSTTFANKVKKNIVDVVPEYAEMTKWFEEATKKINDITKGLSLGKAASTQTQLTKLMSVLRDNFAARQDMIKVIEESTGKNIRAQVAGASLNPALAKWLAWVITWGWIVFGQLANPGFWGWLALASPRLIGELAAAVGTTADKIKSTINFFKNAAPSTTNIVSDLESSTQVNPKGK